MSRGGQRTNAGRPKGRGPFGEPTKPMRIPISLVNAVQQFINQQDMSLPLHASRVQAGTPSPAESIHEKIDLHAQLVQHPDDTFVLEVTGESMIDARIFPGDLLIVDRLLTATPGKIVIAQINGEFTVKRLAKTAHGFRLLAENNTFKHIDVTADDEFTILGVVTNIIHRC